ncbi:serine/threonine-protein kinase [Arthrobacter sp. B1I2]|uniref:serine/threonine-protein kinase n=1 Tax=Arthrobacter sp. B1I2 TaxID=3042263 RepID=UPI002789AA3D|nr:serine/threonine-protein kinase [Arthrobacter sp. B1I2]MDQ0732539.1 serine/threonine protein kinase [Arthrobacter sp. B1I2]
MDVAQVPEVAGYDIGRLLGRGGSADVWLARDQRTGREFALKCFRTPGSTTAGGAVISDAVISEEDVRREIRILSVLDHQHLIRAHDAVRVAGSGSGAALTMDYAAGGSLAQLVAVRGRLSVGETVTVLTPIAQALGYLHGKGFTHSDVSPGNVLFTGQGKPMLSDLGVARMLGDPDGAGTAGTGGFLDPSPVDAVRAGLQPGRDVYSAAALGWFCLTGEAPGRTSDRPPLSLLVPGVPKELAAALEAGLNEDRRLRPDALALARSRLSQRGTAARGPLRCRPSHRHARAVDAASRSRCVERQRRQDETPKPAPPGGNVPLVPAAGTSVEKNPAASRNHGGVPRETRGRACCYLREEGAASCRPAGRCRSRSRNLVALGGPRAGAVARERCNRVAAGFHRPIGGRCRRWDGRGGSC